MEIRKHVFTVLIFDDTLGVSYKFSYTLLTLNKTTMRITILYLSCRYKMEKKMRKSVYSLWGFPS